MNLHVEKSRPPAIARAILERELHEDCHLASTLPAVFGSLEGVVAALVGLSGYRSIISRAVHRTAQDFALLSTLDALPPQFPSLGWDVLLERADGECVQACATALLVNALGSLCDLLGADLTLRLIETVWQGLPADRSLGTVTDRTH